MGIRSYVFLCGSAKTQRKEDVYEIQHFINSIGMRDSVQDARDTTCYAGDLSLTIFSRACMFPY